MNYFERNLQRIEKALDENLNLLSEYDKQLGLESDPRERERIKAEIIFCKQRGEELEKNYEEAEAKLKAYQAKLATEILITPSVTESLLDRQLSQVIELFFKGKIVPILGPGVNRADLEGSSGKKLNGFSLEAKYTIQDILQERHSKDQSGKALFPPSFEEIAAELAERFNYPLNEWPELPRVSQHALVTYSPGSLYEHILGLLRESYTPTSVHYFFANLPQLLRQQQSNPIYPIIITTNYDNLLEQAFDSKLEAYDLLVYNAAGGRPHFAHLPFKGDRWIPIYDPISYNQVKPEVRTILLKVHGVIDRLNSGQDGLIITEDDYIDYMAHFDISKLLPTNLVASLQRHGLLFLGYPLPEWNLRILLHRLWEQRRNPYDSWAVESAPEPLTTSFWQKLGVKVSSCELKEYIQKLETYLGVKSHL